VNTEAHTKDERYMYRGGHYRVRIFHAPGAVRPVVIVSELADNPGRSVTNSWPQLAQGIMADFRLGDDVTWIEHYPAHDRWAARYDLVNMDKATVQWRHVVCEEVERMTGADLDD